MPFKYLLKKMRFCISGNSYFQTLAQQQLARQVLEMFNLEFRLILVHMRHFTFEISTRK